MDDTRFDVTTLGETMLRLGVPAGTRLESAAQLDLYVGGAESNVVGALARLGRRCAWMGSLPDNPLGHRAANEMRQAGIDLQHVVWNRDGRMGLYFAEFAAPPRPIHVTYDRAHSCGALLKPEQVHWEKLLHTRVLHLTGITPPLVRQRAGNCAPRGRTRARRARACQFRH